MSPQTRAIFYRISLLSSKQSFPECLETFQRVRKLSRDSGNFHRSWKLSRAFENFQEVSETFHSVQKLSRVFWKFFRVSVNFPECPKTFQYYGNFPEIPKNFQRFWRLSRVSEKFQGVSETFHSVQKLSRVQNFSRVSRNFPKFPETFLSVCKLLKTKLIFIKFLRSRAKTFLITKRFHPAMLKCLWGFSDSVIFVVLNKYVDFHLLTSRKVSSDYVSLKEIFVSVYLKFWLILVLFMVSIIVLQMKPVPSPRIGCCLLFTWMKLCLTQQIKK